MRVTTILLVLILAAAARAEPEAASEAARLLAEGDRTFSAREYGKATAIYEKAAAAAEKEENRSVLVEALAMAARGYLIRDLPDEGKPWLDRAAKLATADDPAGWSRYLGVRGRFEWKAGDRPAATRTFEAMYAHCMEHDLHARAVDAAHMVAITGTLEQQVDWARKGIAAAEAGGLDGWLGPLWNNLGNTYQDAGKFDEAVEAFRKARIYHWKVGAEINKLIADWAVGMAYRKAGDAKKAIVWMRPVLAWSERYYAEEPSPERAEWVGWSNREMGEIAAMRGERKMALDYLRLARRYLAEAKMPEWDAKGFAELEARIAELEERAGD